MPAKISRMSTEDVGCDNSLQYASFLQREQCLRVSEPCLLQAPQLSDIADILIERYSDSSTSSWGLNEWR